MSSSRRLRLVASAGLSAVLAVPLAVVAAPGAQAAGTSPATLTWLFSEYVHRAAPAGQFAAPVGSDGASVDPSTGRVTFVDGSGRTDTGTHTTTVAYAGSAAFSDSHGGTNYTVTFSDPELTVDATGDGSLSADIAWVAAGETPGSAQDVELTSFTAAEMTWSNPFALTATPDWTNEVAADTYGTGKPVGGASWGQGFVTAIPASIRPFFYASGSANDAAKAPSPFDAVLPRPSVAATTTSQSPSGVAFRVTGAGFTAVTNPGDAGVYVGLAPSGGLPDVSSRDAMSKFAGAAYVSAGQLSGGAFTTALSAPSDLLTRGTSYSIYTWQAHTHSNTTQDTETPVSIDWTKLVATPTKASTAVAAKIARKPTTARGGVLAVTLRSSKGKPSGKVTVRLTKKGARAVTRGAKATNGKARVTLPKLRAGTWKATVVYAGSSGFKAATKVVTLKVAKPKRR